MPTIGKSAIAGQFANPKLRGRADDIACFANVGLIKRLKAGETLIAEGERTRYCYRIVNGVVKEFNSLRDGQRQITDFYGAGELVGIGNPTLQRQSVEAVTDCAVQCISRDALLRAARVSEEVSQLMIELLLDRLDRAQMRTIAIARKSASERVAVFLLRMAEDQDRAVGVFLPMSRQDIADYLGLTIETVCRSLTDMRKSGVISMPTARTFTIKDRSALNAIANEELRLH